MSLTKTSCPCIRSYGIIAYTIFNGELKLLMIQKKNSYGYISIIKGKYKLSKTNLFDNLIGQLTASERNKLIDMSFEELWYDMWNYKNNIVDEIKNKFEKNRDIIIDKIQKTNNVLNETEWEFPKGKREYREKEIDCAKREFSEETGIDIKNVDLIKNIYPFEEMTIGSDIKPYYYKYYLGYIQNNSIPIDNYQKSEVHDIKWCNQEECMHKLRVNKISKRKIITNIFKFIDTYRLI